MPDRDLPSFCAILQSDSGLPCSPPRPRGRKRSREFRDSCQPYLNELESGSNPCHPKTIAAYRSAIEPRRTTIGYSKSWRGICAQSTSRRRFASSSRGQASSRVAEERERACTLPDAVVE